MPSPVKRWSEKMMWPDCSPPMEMPRLIISSITYLSPTGQRTSSMPGLAERDLEADVAHHGRDERVAGEAPLRLHVPRAHQHDGVAVDDAPGVIDEDGAIAVAVERHAHPVAAVAHQRAQALGMRRAAIQVDVAAVRLVADDRDVEAQFPEQPRRDRRRRAVRRVDRELEAAQPLAGPAAPDACGRCRRR